MSNGTAGFCVYLKHIAPNPLFNWRYSSCTLMLKVAVKKDLMETSDLLRESSHNGWQPNSSLVQAGHNIVYIYF